MINVMAEWQSRVGMLIEITGRTGRIAGMFGKFYLITLIGTKYEYAFHKSSSTVFVTRFVAID